MSEIYMSSELVFSTGIQLPNIFVNRAQWARDRFIQSPNDTGICDKGLIWARNELDGLYYSIAGNYSTYSPEEKAVKAAEREKEYDARLETAEELYESVMYQSRIRQAVLDRDEYQCQICGNEAQTKLHVHHILKRKEGGTDHLDNLLTVCPKCHPKADNKLYNPDWTNPRARSDR